MIPTLWIHRKTKPSGLLVSSWGHGQGKMDGEDKFHFRERPLKYLIQSSVGPLLLYPMTEKMKWVQNRIPNCDETQRKEFGYKGFQKNLLTYRERCRDGNQTVIVLHFWDFKFVCWLVSITLYDHQITYCSVFVIQRHTQA